MPIRPFDPNRERARPLGLFRNLIEDEGFPAIDGVLDSGLVRRSEGLSGDKLETFFNRAFDKPELTLDDLYPVVIRSTWRIVRSMARVRGLIGSDEPLELAGHRLPGQWDEPVALAEAADTRDKLVRRLATSRTPLFPPKPPAEWTNGEKDPAYYDPVSDEPLCDYINTIIEIAKRIGIPNTEDGRLALRPLTDPTLLRVAMPSPAEIIACERVMVEETVGSILEHGHIGAAQDLRRRFGLHDNEIGDLVLMARLAMQNVQGGMDTAAKRALMEARLEELAARARKGLDLRAELMTLKELASVQGLKIVDPEGDDLDDMIDVVDEVADDGDDPDNLLLEGNDS